MKTWNHCILVTLAMFSTLNPQLSTGLAQGTAFTYQGRLNDSGAPAHGNYWCAHDQRVVYGDD
jgi:hypothetical protein